MEPKILLELPDTALYQLLTVVKVEDVLRVREVFGDRREGVFAQTERYFQTKYHLPGLRLGVIRHILSQKSKDESLKEAFRFGDYPEYALSVYEGLDKPYLTVEEALIAGREESAIALMKMKPDHLAFFLTLALRYRRLKFLRYLLTHMEFQSLLTNAIRKFAIEEEDIEWALVTLQPKMDEQFVTRILARRVKHYTPVFFATLLTLITDDDLLKAERIYNQATATANYRGEVPDLFREERERRGL